MKFVFAPGQFACIMVTPYKHIVKMPSQPDSMKLPSQGQILTPHFVSLSLSVFIMLRENHIQGLIWFRDYSNVLPIQDYSRTNPIQGLLKCSFYSGLIQVPLLFRTYLIWELFKEIYLFQRLSYSETIQFGLIIYRRYSRAIQRLACMRTNLF